MHQPTILYFTHTVFVPEHGSEGHVKLCHHLFQTEPYQPSSFAPAMRDLAVWKRGRLWKSACQGKTFNRDHLHLPTRAYDQPSLRTKNFSEYPVNTLTYYCPLWSHCLSSSLMAGEVNIFQRLHNGKLFRQFIVASTSSLIRFQHYHHLLLQTVH
jgi:hypothetical protein